jgi:hypothetical protein
MPFVVERSELSRGKLEPKKAVIGVMPVAIHLSQFAWLLMLRIRDVRQSGKLFTLPNRARLLGICRYQRGRGLVVQQNTSSTMPMGCEHGALRIGECAPLAKAWLDVLSTRQTYLLCLGSVTGPGFQDYLQPRREFQYMEPGPVYTHQAGVDDPEMPATPNRGGFQQRGIATCGKHQPCFLEKLPVTSGIGVVAERAGHTIWMPQGCPLGAPPQQIRTFLLEVGVMTVTEFEDMYVEMQQEIKEEQFCGLLYVRTVVAMGV